jgi:hypothetical protein
MWLAGDRGLEHLLQSMRKTSFTFISPRRMGANRSPRQRKERYDAYYSVLRESN